MLLFITRLRFSAYICRNYCGFAVLQCRSRLVLRMHVFTQCLMLHVARHLRGFAE